MSEEFEQLTIGGNLELSDIFSYIKSVIASAFPVISPEEAVRFENYKTGGKTKERSGSIYFYGVKAFGVDYLSKKETFQVSFPEKYINPESSPLVGKIDLRKGLAHYNVSFRSDLACLDCVVVEIFENATAKDIGCCSRYVECSDALHCVNVYPEIFLHCAYRKNLKEGHVFYGKNKKQCPAEKRGVE